MLLRAKQCCNFLVCPTLMILKQESRSKKPILRCIFKASNMEYDPIWGRTLAWQWCVSGQEPSAPVWPFLQTGNSRKPGKGAKVISYLFLFNWHLRLLFARVGITRSFHWWKHVKKYKKQPPPGHHDHLANSGVFIIRPGDHPVL